MNCTETGYSDYGDISATDYYGSIDPVVNNLSVSIGTYETHETPVPINYGPGFNTERGVIPVRVMSLSNGMNSQYVLFNGNRTGIRGRDPGKVICTKRKRNRRN